MKDRELADLASEVNRYTKEKHIDLEYYDTGIKDTVIGINGPPIRGTNARILVAQRSEGNEQTRKSTQKEFLKESTKIGIFTAALSSGVVSLVYGPQILLDKYTDLIILGASALPFFGSYIEQIRKFPSEIKPYAFGKIYGKNELKKLVDYVKSSTLRK